MNLNKLFDWLMARGALGKAGGAQPQAPQAPQQAQPASDPYAQLRASLATNTTIGQPPPFSENPPPVPSPNIDMQAQPLMAMLQRVLAHKGR